MKDTSISLKRKKKNHSSKELEIGTQIISNAWHR